MTALGYRVVDDWMNREQSCEIPFTRGRDIDAYSGYYFSLASTLGPLTPVVVAASEHATQQPSVAAAPRPGQS